MGSEERIPVAYVETWGTTYLNGAKVEHGRQLVRADLLRDRNDDEWEVRDGELHTVLQKSQAVKLELYDESKG